MKGTCAKLVVTGLVLAAAAACSSAPAVPQGSVTSCFQFAGRAIQRHVTVTAVPAACRGLSQAEVNDSVTRALRAAAAGALGKVRQRQIIARDARYVAVLIRVIPASSQPAVTPAPSGPPVAAAPSSPSSQSALSLAALAAWLVTVGLGVSMMARWITRTRRRDPRPRDGRGPVLNFAHLGLALAGLLVWISYLATDVNGLAWAACGLLVAVASLGMTLVFQAATATTDAAGPGYDAPPVNRQPAGRPPVPVIAAHITVACATILLVTLAAIGPG